MNYTEYIKAIETGKAAEAFVGSILRGGHLVGEWFYFCSTRLEKVHINECSNIKYMEAISDIYNNPR